MIPKKYLKRIKETILKVDEGDHQWFIFGSSLQKDHFGDVDLGVIGKIDGSKIRELREIFEDSTLPYKVDIVAFDRVSKQFRNNVLKNKIQWIMQTPKF